MKKSILYLVLAFCLITIVITFYFANRISQEFQESEPFKIVMSELSQVDSLGLKYGYSISQLVGGTLTRNSANFHIKIKTSKDKFEVYADLTNIENWEIKEISVLRKKAVFEGILISFVKL